LGRGGSIARLRLTLRLESAAAIRHGRIHVRTTCHRISLLWRGTISSWAAEASSGRKAASTAASRAVVRGLVYTNRPAVELDVVHGCDRFLGILLLGVSHESETAASAGISILNDDSFLDLAEFFELLAKRAFFGVPCQASNKELRHVGWNAEWDGLENANQSYAVTAGSQAGRVVQMVEI
jgi:hypothetical protein